MTTDDPRCATCANFIPPVEPLMYGQCRAIVDVWCADALNAPQSFLDQHQTALLPGACVTEGTRTDCSRLAVMPTFGCTLHVPKEGA